jgi:acyl carrier protein
MTNAEIFEMVIDVLTKDLDVAMPRERIHAGSLIDADLGLDSVALLGLIAAIETRLGFELSESVLKPGTFRTVASVAEGIAASIADHAAG